VFVGERAANCNHIINSTVIVEVGSKTSSLPIKNKIYCIQRLDPKIALSIIIIINIFRTEE